MRRRLPINILIVEDNSDLALILRESLILAGCNCMTASDVHEALALLPQFRPDCILMDIGLPFMDGFETAKVIHSLPHYATVPIIAHTAWSDPATVEKLSIYQFANHIVKPAMPTRILEVIMNTLFKAPRE